jgi:branched-chain amino acid transport system permease protein
MVFGPKYRALLDNPLKGRMLEYGEMLIEVPKLYGFVAALVTTAVLYWFFQKTRIGRAVRATSLDRDAASLMGINQYRMYNIAFGIGAATAGVAAVTLVPFYNVYPTVGVLFDIKGVYHRGAGRSGQHRRSASGRHYHRIDRIGHSGVHGRHVE